MFLDHQQITQLTGYKYRPYQIKWLTSRGYKFELDRRGNPKVLVNFIDTHLGLISNSSKNKPRNLEPDFTNLRMEIESTYASKKKNK